MCQKYSPYVLKVLRRFCSFFFREGVDRHLVGKATGEAIRGGCWAIGKAAAELLPSWEDKLFESYGVTNKQRTSIDHACHRKTWLSR